MVKIIWLPKAKKRIKEIYLYYKEKSKSAADRLRKDIKSSTIPLYKFPQMGTLEPDLSDLSVSFRSLVVRGNYKIIYYTDEEKEIINIATIWDCRQDKKKLRYKVN
jgi:plasmid stabilization system protein ParE